MPARRALSASADGNELVGLDGEWFFASRILSPLAYSNVPLAYVTVVRNPAA